MPETQAKHGIETGEREPIEMVHEYLGVLRGINIEEYRAASGMLDDVMFHNTLTHGSHESSTSSAIYHWNAFNVYPQSETLERFNTARKSAAIHVVRSMVQGKKFPEDKFGETIEDVLKTVATIDGDEGVPTRKHSRIVRKEIMDVLSFERWRHGDPIVIQRAAEAFKFVGQPKVFGRIMMMRALG